MRDLLIYPDFNMQAIDEMHEILVLLEEVFLEGDGYEKRDMEESEAWAVITERKMLPDLERLYDLIGKRVSLIRLCSLIQSYSTDDVGVLLLQEKAPAVFDITFEEVVEILKMMYQQETPVYQKIYYQELLQKSLLLTQIDKVLPSVMSNNQGTIEMSVIEGWAKRLFDESKEASEIIVI